MNRNQRWGFDPDQLFSPNGPLGAFGPVAQNFLNENASGWAGQGGRGQYGPGRGGFGPGPGGPGFGQFGPGRQFSRGNRPFAKGCSAELPAGKRKQRTLFSF